MSNGNQIRFSERAQQLWDNGTSGLRPDQLSDYEQLIRQVRAATMVIDHTDRVIKPEPQRSATLQEIEEAYVV